MRSGGRWACVHMFVCVYIYMCVCVCVCVVFLGMQAVGAGHVYIFLCLCVFFCVQESIKQFKVGMCTFV